MTRLTDRHEFVIWRYEDDSISVSCHRDDFDVQPYTALMEASVITRCLAEEIHGEEEIFVMRAYSQGSVSTYWRKDEDFPQTWRMYRWLRSRVTQGLHGGLVHGPRPPEWAENLIYRIEYGLLLLTRLLKKASGRKETPDEEVIQEEVITQGTGSDNVIPFPKSQ